MADNSIEIGANSELVEAGECSFIALELTLDGIPTGNLEIIQLQDLDCNPIGYFIEY